MQANWNPWHGCIKYSEGCAHCYVYRGDAKYDRDASKVYKTQGFYAPIAKDKNGEYKIKSGSLIWTCFSSDFLLDLADDWRKEAWDMIRIRKDCRFLFITKRITRFLECVPEDWGNGWDNVTVVCTVENQKRIEERLPIFLGLPILHKCITSEPMLEEIDLSKYLNEEIEEVVVGGESGSEARACEYDWILKVKEQCVATNVTFMFKQTGANFVKNDKLYKIPRIQQHKQAKKAGINYIGRYKKVSVFY